MNRFTLLTGALFVSLLADEVSLETIEVQKAAFDPSIQQLSEEEARKSNAVTLQERLERDVSFSAVTDNKGEMALSFRGLGFRATGYIEDDIPLYRSVNGFTDPKFIMTDATLEMNDGSTTGSLGVSPMGGEVLIYTHIPDRIHTASLYTTISNNDIYAYSSAGSRIDQFYIQADVSYYKQDSYHLSSDFTPTPLQPKGKRLNSDVLQKNLSLKAGIFIGDNTHIAAKIALKRSEFGIPPNVTIDPNHSLVWNDFSRISDKSLDSFYLYGDYSSENFTLTLRGYHDNYQDIYDIFQDQRYTVLAYPSLLYDDSRTGALVKGVFESETHHTTLTVLYERNEHRRKGGSFENARYQADTLKLSALHQWNISDTWQLDGGVSYTQLSSKEASDGSALQPPEDKTAFDAQLKLTYTLSDDLLYGSIANKHRMPAMVEMFTFFPWTIPNPGLKPERSLQYTLGYQHDFKPHTYLDLSLYYYDIKDLIIKENQVHYINRESAIHYGAELRIHTKKIKNHKIQLAYAYAHTRDSLDNPLILIPEHQLTLEDTITLSPELEAFFAYRYHSSRFSPNSAENDLNTLYKLKSYNTVDLQLAYRLGKATQIRIGANNLLDSNYEWRYGYPSKGREYYFSLEWKLP